VFSCTIVVYCGFVFVLQTGNYTNKGSEVISEQRLKSVSQRHDDYTSTWAKLLENTQGQMPRAQCSNNLFLVSENKVNKATAQKSQ